MKAAARSSRTVAAAFLVWCAFVAALAVNSPPPVAAAPTTEGHSHTVGTPVNGLECDPGSESRSDGQACYTYTHTFHNIREHYKHQTKNEFGVWEDTVPTLNDLVLPCSHETDIDNRDEANDHGLAAALGVALGAADEGVVATNRLCGDAPVLTGDSQWTYFETTWLSSGHKVFWHDAVYDTNTLPTFVDGAEHDPSPNNVFVCCEDKQYVTTVQAKDPDAIQVNKVWQDLLRFSSSSHPDSPPGVATPHVDEAQDLTGGGSIQVFISPKKATESIDDPAHAYYINLRVHDLRQTNEFAWLKIGPIWIKPDPNAAPTTTTTPTPTTTLPAGQPCADGLHRHHPTRYPDNVGPHDGWRNTTPHRQAHGGGPPGNPGSATLCSGPHGTGPRPAGQHRHHPFAGTPTDHTGWADTQAHPAALDRAVGSNCAAAHTV